MRDSKWFLTVWCPLWFGTFAFAYLMMTVAMFLDSGVWRWLP